MYIYHHIQQERRANWGNTSLRVKDTDHWTIYFVLDQEPLAMLKLDLHEYQNLSCQLHQATWQDCKQLLSVGYMWKASISLRFHDGKTQQQLYYIYSILFGPILTLALNDFKYVLQCVEKEKNQYTSFKILVMKHYVNIRDNVFSIYICASIKYDN